jgi:hypothetical protein
MGGRSFIAGVLVLATALAALGCDDDTSSPGDGQIYDLSVEVMDWYLRANLQPPVPPDPILCQATLRVTNTNQTNAISGVTIPSAVVYRADNGTELGTIRFETDWHGVLAATEVDTVTITKIQENEEIFPPPCATSVFLRVRVVKTAVQTRILTTDPVEASCPVAAPPAGAPRSR